MEQLTVLDSLEISVVMVLRDRAETVPTAMAHLEQQSLPASRYEVVAVDNGSSDDTLGVLERYAAGAPVPIQVIDACGASFGRARNLGVERAHGRFLVFLDPDVLASPNLLERYLREFELGPTHGWLQGRIAMHPQLPPNVLTRHLLAQELPPPANPERLAPTEWHGYNVGAARALLRDAGGFDETFQEAHYIESALAHRLAERGIFGRTAPRSYVYEWRAAGFDEERARCYARGYGLHHLESCIGEASAAALRAPARGLQWRAQELMMPFYVRTCRDAGDDVRYAGRFFRRVLLHDMHRGYMDARRGRPARAAGH